MEFVVEKEWLAEQLENEGVKVVDCRFNLSTPAEGKELYRKSHIPGAFYFDMDEQMSSPVKEHGGRHPLPDLEQFRHGIERVGIGNAQTVVVYDGGGMQFATRFWWLMRYLGHEKVYVLNGGYRDWVGAGYPVTEEVPEARPAQFRVNLQQEMLADYEEVRRLVLSKAKGAVLIDSRASERYRGEIEPLDRKAGHIPSALNKFWEEGLEAGSFKTPEEQKQRFADLDKDEEIIVYCGSGVTATPNYLALKMAGFQNVKLYAGSYSDWVSYEENPVALGEEGRTQLHEMMLQPEPMRKIQSGQKTIELRLNDEKRQQVRTGDRIRFTNTEDDADHVLVQVGTIHRFPSFTELYAALSLEKCGYEQGEKANPTDMEQYYPLERQVQFGVLGIEVEVLE